MPTVCNTGMPVSPTEMESNTIGLIINNRSPVFHRRRRCFKATAETANDSVDSEIRMQCSLVLVLCHIQRDLKN